MPRCRATDCGNVGATRIKVRRMAVSRRSLHLTSPRKFAMCFILFIKGVALTACGRANVERSPSLLLHALGRLPAALGTLYTVDTGHHDCTVRPDFTSGLTRSG